MAGFDEGRSNAASNGPDFLYREDCKLALENIGRQPACLKQSCFNGIFVLFSQVVSDDALIHWLDQYNSSADTCTHAYWLVFHVSHRIFQNVIKT